jgi:hypothetical protein
MTIPNMTLKIIATFFIFCGAAFLAFGIYRWVEIFHTIHISSDDFSLLKILKNYHSFFLTHLLALISGIMLLFGKKLVG